MSDFRQPGKQPARLAHRVRCPAVRRLISLLLLCGIVLAASGCSELGGLLTMPLIPSNGSETETGAPSASETETVYSPLQINEVCSSNASILKAANGLTPDWIELHNTGSQTLSLAGYGLSDNVRRPLDWTLPAVTIPADGYLVVFASGEIAETEAKASGASEIFATFRLSSAGEDLILSSPSGQVIDEWKVPAVPSDCSYGRDPVAASAEAAKVFFAAPTPGKANGADGVATADEVQASVVNTLLISEYVTDNAANYDEDGDFPDWVEIWNSGTEPLVLTGFTLTDNATKPDKWSFPALTLQPGQYQLLWLSGKDKTWVQNSQSGTSADTLAGIHVSFKLSGDDTDLLLLDPRGQIVSKVEIVKLPANVSRGIRPGQPDTWDYYPRPTPGRVNDTPGFADLQAATALVNRPVWINEVFALNTTVRGSGEADWIELYNNSGQQLNLQGYSLTDDAAQPRLQKLDGIVLKSGGYKVIPLTRFNLDAAGETVTLFNAAGEPVDIFATGYLRPGTSSGRKPLQGSSTSADRVFFLSPTKGSANTGQAYRCYAAVPEITVSDAQTGALSANIYQDEPVSVELTSATPGSRIYYTLNGSPPTTSSSRYSKPLSVKDTAVIRAIAIADGTLASNEAMRTLLYEKHHDLPVISVMARESDLFGGTEGVWSNYSADLEKPVAVSFYETNGSLGVQFKAGIAMHGQYSRKEIQKSLELNLRTYYGDDTVTYPFFENYDVSTFKHLILRTSSQDWQFSKLRDAYMTMVVQGKMAVDTMSWRPCVLYINGKYYGLYEIRENVDQYYFAAHHGTDPTKVDLIKGNRIVLEGNDDTYQALLQYVKTHSMKTEKYYQYVLSQIDEDSLMDWVIVETFYNNLDSGNKKFWRERKAGAQWRWIMYDFDWAMFPSTYQKNILKYDLLDPAGHGQYNIFDSTLQVKLMENPAFKEKFIQRYAKYLNTIFQPKRMVKILDAMTEQIRSEMPRQIARWGRPSSVNVWENNVATLRRISLEKRGRMITILQESFNLSSSKMKQLFPEDF